MLITTELWFENWTKYKGSNKCVLNGFSEEKNYNESLQTA